MGEEWKVVKGHPDYEVSNLGRLRKGSLILKLDQNTKAYRPDGIQITKTKLLRTHWKYEWIKDLKDGEEAKPINGNEEYFVTTFGRVFSLRYYKWLKPSKSRDYYYKFSIDGKPRIASYLVGSTFLEGHDIDINQVMHINENLPFPEINHLANLKLGSPSDNRRDAIIKGRCPKSKLSHHQIRIIKRLIGKIHYKEIAEIMEIDSTTICDIKSGKTWSWIDELDEKDRPKNMLDIPANL